MMVVRIAVLFGTMHLGLVFVAAGLVKSLDSRAFRETLADHHLLPNRISAATAYLLSPTETLLGIALFAGLAPRTTASIAAAFFLVFVMYRLFLVWKRRSEAPAPKPCHCFGNAYSGTVPAAEFTAITANLLIALAISIVAPPDFAYSPAASVVAGTVLALVIVWVVLMKTISTRIHQRQLKAART